ncbi:hypothetical protein Salat_1562100 [Sesamum alatum]|uniref:Uncharacterized protein n=1 Tax=Sesamum alatum TaxID=300844 RepID=A0AAE1YCT9_9LAMI|nr:hypothetical protein Salat_1562100 [Sesamum alatum]
MSQTSFAPKKNVIDQQRRVKRVSWRLLFAVQKLMSLRSQHERNFDDGVDVFEKVSKDLQELVEEVGSVVEEMMKIKKKDHQKTEDLLFSNYLAYVGSPIQGPGRKTGMVGFYEEMVAIKDQLCGGSSNLQL